MTTGHERLALPSPVHARRIRHRAQILAPGFLCPHRPRWRLSRLTCTGRSSQALAASAQTLRSTSGLTGAKLSMEIFDYDNVLLLPRKCRVESRSECDPSVEFGGRTFKLPVVPANMKTV